MRYGYRPIHILLRREGWSINQKRVYRLYKGLGLQLRNKTPKRCVKAKLREDRKPPIRVNETWAMDFVHDQLVTGTKIRVLTVIDTFSRYSPAIVPRLRFRAPDVIEVLEKVGAEIGLPGTIRVDQGSGFVSRDLDLWACQRNITHDVSRPGKPIDRASFRHWSEENGEGLHREPEREVPHGMPERALVHEPRRRGPKMRGLA